jgi:aspartate/methionine/tyrosine aminotransferase
MICNDNPYSFILNDRPLSILAHPRAKECCLELNSLSKAHNMAGWRIGMVASDRQVISEILKVKSQMDSGMFKPLQLAAVQALAQGPEWFAALNDEYRRRRVLAGEIFDLLGVEYDHDSTGMFLWGRVSQHAGSGDSGRCDDCTSRGRALSDRILYEAGVFITPGFIFGKNGEDYVRISLCAKPEVLERAAQNIKSVFCK